MVDEARAQDAGVYDVLGRYSGGAGLNGPRLTGTCVPTKTVTPPITLSTSFELVCTIFMMHTIVSICHRFNMPSADAYGKLGRRFARHAFEIGGQPARFADDGRSFEER